MLDRYAADIVVLQEIARPATDSDGHIWRGDRERQGVAVVARPPYSVRPYGPPNEGTAQFWPVQVEGPVSFSLVVVCTALRGKYVRGACHAIDAHTSLLLQGDCVVLGDFNSNACWDSQHPADLNHSSLVARLERLGLQSAYHAHFEEAQGQETTPTFYLYGHQERHHHIDYCFIPSSWMSNVRGVSVGDYESFRGRSDHRPLFVEIEGLQMMAEAHPNEEAREAAQVLERVCFDRTQEDLVLSVLHESEEFAAQLAPNAVAATLFSNGFRLNVGQVEAVTFFDGVVRVNLCALQGTAPAEGADLVPANYRSLAQPLAAFVGTPERFEALRGSLRNAHRAFLTRAALTKSGEPRRGTSFRSSHCEGLLRLARGRIGK